LECSDYNTIDLSISLQYLQVFSQSNVHLRGFG
jgi:hypothetical protein